MLEFAESGLCGIVYRFTSYYQRIIRHRYSTLKIFGNCAWIILNRRVFLNDELANAQQEKLLSLLAIASSEDPLVPASNIDFTSDDVKQKVNQVKLKLSGNYSNLKLVTALEKCKGDIYKVLDRRLPACHRAITGARHGPSDGVCIRVFTHPASPADSKRFAHLISAARHHCSIMILTLHMETSTMAHTPNSK